MLVASDRRDLDALGASLNLAHGIAVRALALDLAREADPGARIAAALDGMPPVSALLLPIGYSRDDDDFSLDAGAIGQLLAVNLHAPLAIVHALLPRSSKRTARSCCSAASPRRAGADATSSTPARSVRSFRFTKACANAIAARELRVQLYELGFMATNLTYGMKLPLPAVEADVVARIVVRRLGAARRGGICRAGGRRSRCSCAGCRGPCIGG